MGLVKFILPNDANIYLHGTPAPGIFGRPRRDLSHGCVRVGDPVALGTRSPSTATLSCSKRE